MDPEEIVRTPDIPAETSRTPFVQPPVSRKWIWLGVLIVVIAIIIGVIIVVKGPASESFPQQAAGSIPITPSAEAPEYGDYAASFSWDGTLEEKFFYRVTGADKFSMLYRYFDEPLLSGSLPEPHIEFLSLTAPEGTTAYIKDTTGKVSFPNGGDNQNVLQDITSRARTNEAGIYRTGGFAPGTYPVIYQFRFFPPVEYDESAVHLNINLMESHPAYQNIRVQVPAESVREIYFSPSHLSVRRNNDMIIATGNLAKDEALGFEVILDRNTLNTIPGFPVSTDDVTRKTEAAYQGQTPFRP